MRRTPAASLNDLPRLADALGAHRRLAENIRSFVAGMPAVETMKDALKRQLAERFARTDAAKPAPPAARPSPTRPKPPERKR